MSSCVAPALAVFAQSSTFLADGRTYTDLVAIGDMHLAFRLNGKKFRERDKEPRISLQNIYRSSQPHRLTTNAHTNFRLDAGRKRYKETANSGIFAHPPLHPDGRPHNKPLSYESIWYLEKNGSNHFCNNPPKQPEYESITAHHCTCFSGPAGASYTEIAKQPSNNKQRRIEKMQTTTK